MIQESTIAELDPRQIKQLEAADKAVTSNPSYSVEIYSAVLKLSPVALNFEKSLELYNYEWQKSLRKDFQASSVR